MSSASSILLGIFAILSIILATTAGTESDVTGLLEINVTTLTVLNSSIDHQIRSDDEPMKSIEATTMTTMRMTSTTNVDSLTANERTSSMNRNSLAGNSKITTVTAITPVTLTIDDENKEISSLSGVNASAPQQERLIGLVSNTTNNFLEEMVTSKLLSNETSSHRFSTPETSTIFVNASITSSSVETISIPTIRTQQLTTVALSKAVAFKTRNDLVGGTFHEIKSAQKINSINQSYIGSKIVKPNIAPALGKYTPYFEDGQKEVNVTARIGNTVILDCEIGMLGNKTVTWSYHSTDVIRLLTVGRNAYSIDQRISLFFRYPTNWRLRIQYATPRDSGLYECQVATFPPLVKKIYLLVTAPILVIMDDSGRIKSGERHLKAGSALRLRCEARDIPEQYNETVIWTRGDEILNEDVSENRTAEYLDGKEVQVIVSTIVVEKATPRHAGNYSCLVPEKARATVAVHVLNGELPAAVHDGNGVSKSVLNFWLIHLTVSFVFSR